MARSHASLFSLVLALALYVSNTNAAAGDHCSAIALCDSSAPCCSADGVCGSGSLACAGGCNPLSSNTPTSCQPNPVCQTTNITFPPEAYNNVSYFQPILQYDGDATKAPFTLDYGSLGKGTEGVLAQMTIDRQVKLSTTRYLLYGDVEAKLRHNASTGLVATMILMSDVKDEVDWEFTTSDASNAQSNYFSLGVAKLGNGDNVGPSSLDVADWNTFGLNWQPDQLQWKINGQVVRTLTKNKAGDSYPRSPSRVQMSVWAGGNATSPEGVRSWAGGAIDWDTPEYTSQGFYAMELASFSMSCASNSVSNLDSTGTGNNVTSWVYTGKNDTSGQPVVQLNRAPMTFIDKPSAGGYYGLPGYTQQQTANTAKNNNMWDGSGDTGVQDSDSGSGGGGISAAAAKKYGVPIGAAVAGLIVLWAIVMTCVRRRRKAARRAARDAAAASGVGGGAGGIAASSVPPKSSSTEGASKGGYISSGIGPNSGRGKYEAIGDDYYDPAAYAASNDYLPMGAEKRGAGVASAAAGGMAGRRAGEGVSFASNAAYDRPAYGSSLGHYADGSSTMSPGESAYYTPKASAAGGAAYPSSAQSRSKWAASSSVGHGASSDGHGRDSYAMQPPSGANGGYWTRTQAYPQYQQQQQQQRQPQYQQYGYDARNAPYAQRQQQLPQSRGHAAYSGYPTAATGGGHQYSSNAPAQTSMASNLRPAGGRAAPAHAPAPPRVQYSQPSYPTDTGGRGGGQDDGQIYGYATPRYR